jgi:uncharacterized protein
MDPKIQKHLLTIARSVIAGKLDLDENEPKMPTGKGANVLREKRGVFVTLEMGGRLRGCIGHIEGVLPLILGVRENAESAAFKDPRFDPLSADEFDEVGIEISVLSVPQKLEFDGPENLKSKLRPGIDGVVLTSGFAKATYLPQVWNEFPEDELKEKFLSSLCMKAGLDPDEWEKGEVKVETYQAEIFRDRGLF